VSITGEVTMGKYLSEGYLLVFEYEKKALRRAEVWNIFDYRIARDTFDLIANLQREQFKLYGAGQYDWNLSLYDLDAHEAEIEELTFSYGKPGAWEEYVCGIKTTAMRRRYIGLRELDGRDD
jgi:hypothetical protein